MRIFLLNLLFEEGKIIQLSSMLKLLHMGNKLKGMILLLKPYLEDHSSCLLMIILRIIKMLLIISLSEYTLVELNSRLFDEKISFLGSFVICWFFWWPFPWVVSFLVCLCLFWLGELAFATFFFLLCGNLFLVLPRLHLVCILFFLTQKGISAHLPSFKEMKVQSSWWPNWTRANGGKGGARVRGKGKRQKKRPL
jgi:hypothetical protein